MGLHFQSRDDLKRTFIRGNAQVIEANQELTFVNSYDTVTKVPSFPHKSGHGRLSSFIPPIPQTLGTN